MKCLIDCCFKLPAEMYIVFGYFVLHDKGRSNVHQIQQKNRFEPRPKIVPNFKQNIECFHHDNISIEPLTTNMNEMKGERKRSSPPFWLVRPWNVSPRQLKYAAAMRFGR